MQLAAEVVSREKTTISGRVTFDDQVMWMSVGQLATLSAMTYAASAASGAGGVLVGPVGGGSACRSLLFPCKRSRRLIPHGLLLISAVGHALSSLDFPAF
jgi:hypothetical protein